MFQQTITIAGQSLPLAYCFATEIAFTDLSGQNINDFFPSAIESLKAKKMPDTKLVIFLIVAAALAAAQAEGTDCPIADSDLMYNATPEELGTALGIVIGLRAKFYHLPPADEQQAEAEAAKKGDTQGNS